MKPASMKPAAVIAALDAEARVTETPCGDGRMIWRRWGKPRGNVRPVILLHGGSGSWTHWFRTIPGLANRGDVWAADLPGLGDSDMPPGEATPESSGAVVAQSVREIFGHEPVDLVAFSFGAHVGTYAARHLASQLGSYTITGAAAMGLPHPILEFPKERPNMSADERNALHRRTLEILMFKEPARIDDLAVFIQAENIAKARFRSRAFAATDDIARLLPDIRVAVNAIWGADDCLALPDLATRYDVLRRGHPELITRTVADAGHWTMYEQAEAYTAALIEVLEARG